MCVNNNGIKEEDELSVFIKELIENIRMHYDHCITSSGTMICQLQNREIRSLGKKVFITNKYNLVDAIQEVEKDTRFLLERRGKLIGGMKPSPGKIAGIIAYRLAKSQIVHLLEGCASCSRQCAVWLNSEFALKCAWEYIGIKYSRVKDGIRRELFYTLNYRHVNQETLGLVFDTILTTYGNNKVVA